ncbi:hypothetical protein NY547_16545 [Cnuibacter physcomitrellae]|uniref:hypothetical protein n=1 Tax=Cnuibacter physcomitrellae TaxID=1619308 RepID=UPI002175ACBC|nr:hypothetical protein [Cnuibacter physcomitrellae]MCS5498862.1 hypothetical protein [Cnuibacter physcomitrellae]
MDVEELLARAWGAVEKAGIPEPLQEYAFREALARLDRMTPTLASSQPGHGYASRNMNDQTGKEAGGSDSRTADELFAKFANESEIPVADLERVFYFSNGEPHLNGPRSKLGKTASDQAKAVAVALTAAYDFALDRQASDDVVRAEASRLKCDLGGNWARTMNGLSAVSWVGANRQKQFKTKADTAEALRKLVSSILGQTAE